MVTMRIGFHYPHTILMQHKQKSRISCAHPPFDVVNARGSLSYAKFATVQCDQLSEHKVRTRQTDYVAASKAGRKDAQPAMRVRV